MIKQAVALALVALSAPVSAQGHVPADFGWSVLGPKLSCRPLVFSEGARVFVEPCAPGPATVSDRAVVRSGPYLIVEDGTQGFELHVEGKSVRVVRDVPILASASAGSVATPSASRMASTSTLPAGASTAISSALAVAPATIPTPLGGASIEATRSSAGIAVPASGVPGAVALPAATPRAQTALSPSAQGPAGLDPAAQRAVRARSIEAGSGEAPGSAVGYSALAKGPGIAPQTGLANAPAASLVAPKGDGPVASSTTAPKTTHAPSAPTAGQTTDSAKQMASNVAAPVAGGAPRAVYSPPGLPMGMFPSVAHNAPSASSGMAPSSSPSGSVTPPLVASAPTPLAVTPLKPVLPVVATPFRVDYKPGDDVAGPLRRALAARGYTLVWASPQSGLSVREPRSFSASEPLDLTRQVLADLGLSVRRGANDNEIRVD